MNYSDGKLVCIGDTVDLGSGWTGVVVADIDNGQYTIDFPESDWSYLEVGVLVKSREAGVFHFAHKERDFELIKRA